MKAKERKDLGQKTLQELLEMLRVAKDAVYTLRLEKAQYKTKNMRSVFNKRKDVARILTKIKEKEFLVTNPASRNESADSGLKSLKRG